MKLRIMFYVCCLLKLLDVLTTYFLVDAFGSGGEVNPVVKYTIDTMGLPWAMVLNFVFSFAFMLFAYKLCRMWIFVVFLVMLSFVVLSNSFMVYLVMR